MKNKNRIFGYYFSLLLLLTFLFIASAQKYNPNSTEKIPADPSIKIGTLENGLKYYIKYNKKPENRAELFLVVNAGSICEDPDQNGLAHFCEHMAFNGTKNFPKQALVDYLESIGVKFGPELNAYTNYDETVYMLQLPTDNQEQFLKGFQIIEDWAFNVSYEPTEIDKERGVILEEWRLGRGADARVEKKHDKIVYYNSKYAIHDVIGDTNILLKAPYEAFTRFYKDWYRPDLMAVIAVGDFDVDNMEKLIKERLGKYPKPSATRQRPYVEIPYHKDLLVSIAQDPELSFPRVVIYFKDKGKGEETYKDYYQNLKAQIFSKMLNNRLNEYLRKENPPFRFFVFTGKTDLGRLNNAYIMFAGARGEDIQSCVKTLITEAFRVYQHGFLPSEFERAKKEVLREYEKAFDERDKTESINYAFEFSRNFLQNEAIPGIEKELEIVKEWLPVLTLNEINELTQKFIKKENAVIAISAPDRAEVVVPTEDEVRKMFEEISNSKLDKYVDKAPTKPLFTQKVTEGKIVNEKYLKEIDTWEFILDNGAKVVAKSTDFKNDEIRFEALSYGGSSLISDEDYFNARFATSVITQSGLGSFDRDMLEKYLSDKIVNVRPFISDYYEGLEGSSSTKDIQTLFEMINLYFTEPRIDKTAFNAFKTQTISNIIDSQNRPESVFRDSVSYILNNRHFRRQPVTKEIVENLDMNKCYDIFTQRFSNPADFVFIFVGNFNIDELKNYITKYIGSIPTDKTKENWKDVGIRYAKGKVEKNVIKGIEAKSFVQMTISGDFSWNYKERFMFNALTNLLDIRLREVLREDLGGTYGVAVFGRPSLIPYPLYTLTIYFGCDPNRVDELSNSAIEVLKDVATNIQDEKYLVKVKEIFRRELEKNLKENDYWIEKISEIYLYNDPPDFVKKTREMIDKLNLKDLRDFAKKYIKLDNFAKFVLYPEGKQ